MAVSAIVLRVGNGVTTLVAKAGTQSGDPIPVDFTWESKDADIVSVDGGTITAHEKGMTTITASAVGRGIDVTVTVNVHDPVKSIVAMAEGATSLVIGGTVTVSATAYEGEEGAGDPITGIDVAWMSSDEDVATVDAEGVVTAKSAGTADITVEFGDVESNKVTVTVFDVVQPAEKRLRVDRTKVPIAVEINSDSTDVTSNATLTVNLDYSVDGGETWFGQNGDIMFEVASGPLTIVEDDATTKGKSVATLTIGFHNSEMENPVTGVTGTGTAFIMISSDGADPIFVQVNITKAEM